MRKILYIVPHRLNRSPGQRFRCEHFLTYLSENGYKITYSNIISEKDDKVFYSKGRYFIKFIILLKSIFIRLRDLFRAPMYDIIFIYREALMLGPPVFEWLFSLTGIKIIFDFDDAIWLNDVSEGNRNLKWLKKPSKTKRIIKLSDLVFAGNPYLAGYALKFNKNVQIVPTVIDTEYHKRIAAKKTSESISIGWTGTATTLKHFETILPVLYAIRKKYGDTVHFRIIVNFPYRVEDLGINAQHWKLESEINDLHTIDIGIMPLPDDDWANGKCGFKGLQYMSLEIPSIMSPVGVNTEIIEDGKNGFLAATDDEWIEKLSLLIESPEWRNKLGKAGRQTVIERYSVESQKENYLRYINELLDTKR